MRKLAWFPVIALFVIGCAGAAATDVPAASPSATPAATASPTPVATPSPRYPVEAAPGKLVVRIASEGGFISPAFQLTRLPIFALYGDGTALVPAATTGDAPFVPEVGEMRVTPAEIQRILALADTDGLLQDATYNSPGNPDAAGTLFTTVVGGRLHAVSVSSLSGPGVGGGGIGGGGGGSAASPGSPESKLLDFETKMADLPAFLGRAVSDSAYSPTAIRILTSSAGAPDASQPSPSTARWPLSTDPSAGGKTTVDGVLCTLASGPDLKAFRDAATSAAATSETIWTAASGRYTASVRPLYPDEHSC